LIKLLFLLAVLLVPSIAYAGSPGADLAVQIVPALTIPAGAQAAGFTTLARYDDFSQPLPANWLGCEPADGQQHQWWQDSGQGVPCDINQTFDPLSEGRVIDIRWIPSYHGNNFPFNMQQIKTDSPATAPGPVYPPTFPNGYYEATFRVQSTPDVTSGGHEVAGNYHAFWMIFSNPSGNGFEGDAMEDFQVYGGCPGSTLHHWVNANFIGPGTSGIYQAPCSYDPRQYHTWGLRRTSDGNNSAFCSYLDGQFVGCVTINNDSFSASERWDAILWNGIFCTSNSDTSCAGSYTSLDMFVKSVRVWSCADWQTTMCTGTVLTGAP
jgi:hypothetical protein